MNRLKDLRLARKLNQKEAASILGIAQPTLSGWETGRTQIDYDNLLKIADYYGVTLDYLLGRTEENKESSAKEEKNELTSQEKEHLKNYRQLDADAKFRIDSQIEFELYKQAKSNEKGDANLA